MKNISRAFSYCNPVSEKHHAFQAFDTELTFNQQLKVAAMTTLFGLLTFPFTLFIGGMVVFRALVNHYSPYSADELPDNSAGRTNEVGKNILNLRKPPEPDGELESALDELSKKYHKGFLTDTLKKIPQPVRLPVLRLSLKLGAEITSPHEFCRLVEFLYHMGSRRESAVGRLQNYGQNVVKIEEFAYIDRILEKVAPDDVNAFFSIAGEVMEKMPSGFERIRCLEAYGRHADSEASAKALRKGLNMLQTVKLSARFIRIWPELVKLPRELYPALEGLVKKLTNTGDDGLVLLYALKIVSGIPAAKAKVLLNDASDFLRGFGQEDLGTSLKMLESISQLPVEKRVKVVAGANKFVKHLNPDEKRFILHELCYFNGEISEFDEQHLRRLICGKRIHEQLLDRVEASEKEKIYSTFIDLAAVEQFALFAEMPQIISQVNTAAEFQELILAIKMIAPEVREVSAQRVNSHHFDSITCESIVRFLFNQDPAVKLASKRYLEKYLNAADAPEASKFATKIWRRRRLFGFDPSNPDAFTCLIAGLAIIKGHVKDSFVLYSHLVKKDKKVPTPQVEMPVNLIEGERVRLNARHFEYLARNSKRVKFGDLTAPVTFDRLKRMFHDFEARLSCLPMQRYNKLWKEDIYNCFEFRGDENSVQRVNQHYRQLKSAFLNEEGYVALTLKRRGADDQAVATEYLHIYSVINFIMKGSTEIQANSDLTAQEELLLHMLSSIQNCSVGKKGGFADFYAGLPKEYQIHGVTEASNPSEKAKEYLNNAVQRFLGSRFNHNSTDAMAQKLIGGGSDRQYVHTCLYLKNLIGKRVGMQWDISFDAHAGCIKDTLFRRSLSRVLKIFYEFVTPQLLVDAIDELICRDFRDEMSAMVADLQKSEQALASVKKRGKLPILSKKVEILNKKISALHRQLREGRSREKIQELQALNTQLQQAKNAYRQEAEQCGIPELEKIAAEKQKRLDAQGEMQANFLNLLGEAASGEFFDYLDSNESVFVLNKKGVVRLLAITGFLDTISA